MYIHSPEMLSLISQAQEWELKVRKNPFDWASRASLANAMLELQGSQFGSGTRKRSEFLLELMVLSPTPCLQEAYFDNLQSMVRVKEKLATPGKLVLGLGSGRCGSTTITALLARVEGSCSTHENPPHITYETLDEQVRFHLARFEFLLQYFPFVFDSAPWWLNVIDLVWEKFPECKAIGLHRDDQKCAESFVTLTGRGLGSVNHWGAIGNGIWNYNLFTCVFPTYEIPAGAAQDPDATKLAAALRYVRECNERLRALAKAHPTKILLVQTETLSNQSTQRDIFEFAGVKGEPLDVRKNVAGTSVDGDRAYRF